MIIAVVTLTICSGNIAPEGKKTYESPQTTGVIFGVRSGKNIGWVITSHGEA